MVQKNQELGSSMAYIILTENFMAYDLEMCVCVMCAGIYTHVSSYSYTNIYLCTSVYVYMNIQDYIPH